MSRPAPRVRPAGQAKSRVLNSPAWQEMRRMDAKLYTVLGMRSFNRGPPMFPEAAMLCLLNLVYISSHIILYCP